MILQSTLPYTPWSDPRMTRLPGIQPLDLADWLVADEVFAGQMAERDRLLREETDQVYAIDAGAEDAARDLLDLMLELLSARDDYVVEATRVRRPDGVWIDLDRDRALMTAGRLVQEDITILQRPDGAEEHILTGGVVCFPASWTLAEKYMRPLIRIHRPVVPYDDGVASRVQRLFDGLKAGRALWRANAHFYDEPTLFRPFPEAAPRAKTPGPAPYIRSERQVLTRLPRTGAMVFTVHTYMIAREDLSPQQKQDLIDHPITFQEVER